MKKVLVSWERPASSNIFPISKRKYGILQTSWFIYLCCVCNSRKVGAFGSVWLLQYWGIANNHHSVCCILVFLNGMQTSTYWFQFSLIVEVQSGNTLRLYIHLQCFSWTTHIFTHYWKVSIRGLFIIFPKQHVTVFAEVCNHTAHSTNFRDVMAQVIKHRVLRCAYGRGGTFWIQANFLFSTSGWAYRSSESLSMAILVTWSCDTAC